MAFDVQCRHPKNLARPSLLERNPPPPPPPPPLFSNKIKTLTWEKASGELKEIYIRRPFLFFFLLGFLFCCVWQASATIATANNNAVTSAAAGPRKKAVSECVGVVCMGPWGYDVHNIMDCPNPLSVLTIRV